MHPLEPTTKSMFVASINTHEEWFENALLSLLDLQIGNIA